MINFKKFASVFDGERMEYEIQNDLLYLASPSMIIRTYWPIADPPYDLVGHVKKADSGLLVNLFNRQTNLSNRTMFGAARETGLTFTVRSYKKKRTVSVLIAEPEGLVPYAVYVREDFLRILGKDFSLMLARGPLDMITVGNDKDDGKTCDFIAYITPIRLSEPSLSNLKEYAKAILYPFNQDKVTEVHNNLYDGGEA